MRKASLLLLLAVGGCRITGPVTLPDAGADGDSAPDADGDTISDADERAGDRRDTDADGTPDFEDSDSDGDGLPDSLEAGDADTGTPPVDSDRDGMPDFVDADSDNNGILDANEADGDYDEDGTPNFADDDDDGDTVPDVRELDGSPSDPPDFDGDGIADYQDNDSDNDTIGDRHERDADTDRDGTPDMHDLDSDRDGLIDAMEVDDGLVETPPPDTDGDTIPDFRDPDSDNDGLADGDEAFIHHTDPTARDSDGDGVDDLIEVGAGTDANDATDNPRTRGDFVFVVPYQEDPDPERDTLEFTTNIQFADVYFLFDISTSMNGEITALRNAVTTIMTDLTCADTLVACTSDSECASPNVCSPFSGTCIEDPATTNCVASIWSGGGYYEASYWNTRSLQSDPMATRDALNVTTFGGTEAMNGAAQSVAEPGAITSNGCTGPSGSFIGCPSFRSEAVRILTIFTDEDSDGSTTTASAAAALVRQGITMIGVWSGSTGDTGRSSLVNLAMESNSLDRLGAPLVFNGTDAGVVPAVTGAINEIVEGVPLRVTIDATDEPDDAGDALYFIEQLVTNTIDPGCSMIETDDSDDDGVTETFPRVTPGTPVCWDVDPRRNETVMPAATPLVFRARLTVYGDGSPLDSRLVYFLVPPEIPEPGGPH